MKQEEGGDLEQILQVPVESQTAVRSMSSRPENQKLFKTKAQRRQDWVV